MSKKAWNMVPTIKQWREDNVVMFVSVSGYTTQLDEAPQHIKDKVKEVEEDYDTEVIFIMEDQMGWMSYVFSDTEPWVIDEDNVGFMALVEGDFTESGSIGVTEKFGRVMRSM